MDELKEVDVRAVETCPCAADGLETIVGGICRPVLLDGMTSQWH